MNRYRSRLRGAVTGLIGTFGAARCREGEQGRCSHACAPVVGNSVMPTGRPWQSGSIAGSDWPGEPGPAPECPVSAGPEPGLPLAFAG